MNIKLDLLRSFTTVAECGSLQEAAEKLSRSPSAISMSLKRLSDQLGVELFETDRKSSLTPTGCFVLEEGRRALNNFDESMRTIQRYTRGEIGATAVRNGSADCGIANANGQNCGETALFFATTTPPA